MFVGIITLICTAIGVLFTSCTQNPGTEGLVDAFLPLSTGFGRIFNISLGQAQWVSFPGLFANFYGFVWASGRQFSSMAKSGLLPAQMGFMTPGTDTPYVSLITGMILSIALALISYYDVINIHFKEDVKHMYMLSSYVISIAMFVSFIVFKQKYSSLPRSFSSPFGVYGAVLGMMIFFGNSISVVIASSNFQLPIVVLIAATILMAVYYIFVLHGNQQFSEEEKEKLFKAYLINGEQFYLNRSVESYFLLHVANLKSRAAQKNRKSAGSPRGGPHSPRGSAVSPRNQSRAPSTCSDSQYQNGSSDCGETVTASVVATNKELSIVEKVLSISRKQLVAPEPDISEDHIVPPEHVDGEHEEEEEYVHVPSRHTSIVAHLSEKLSGWMEEYRGSSSIHSSVPQSIHDVENQQEE